MFCSKTSDDYKLCPNMEVEKASLINKDTPKGSTGTLNLDRTITFTAVKGCSLRGFSKMKFREIEATVGGSWWILLVVCQLVLQPQSECSLLKIELRTNTEVY